MVKTQKRGASLMTVILLALIMVSLAAAMTGLYSHNLNFTQGYYNGMVAQNEAEAGLSELLYQLTRNENMTYGQNEEEIRSTISTQFEPNEAYHVVTFRSGSSFPRSTNNVAGGSPGGSLGRTVPPGSVHAISTGYCRGQWRTIECVIEKPPFPFGLATSGELVSHDPLVVRGVSSAGEFDPDNPEADDRPGHILCNSEDGVSLNRGNNPPRDTYVSGFIKSVGQISVEQPATVLGGLRPGADPSTMVEIDIESFRNRFTEGIVDLVDDTYTEPQEMDIMYRYSGNLLHYTNRVQLKKAFLFVDGDLQIDGALFGEGLIVVNGNATFNSGTALAGSNNLAVLASGNINIRGSGNNYFQGLVYSEGNFDARNIVVMGNTIVNSSNPNRGRADLHNVTVVADEGTADMTINITSSRWATGQNAYGEAPFPLMPNVNPANGQLTIGWMPGDLNGWPAVELDQAAVTNMMRVDIWDRWPGAYLEDNVLPIVLGSAAAGDGAGLWTQMTQVYAIAAAAANLMDEMRELHDLREELANMAPDDPRRGEVQDAINDLLDEEEDFEEFEADFMVAADALAGNYLAYTQSHADETGTFNRGQAPMDINEQIVFDLNTYLPNSERVKVSYWQMYNRRL